MNLQNKFEVNQFFLEFKPFVRSKGESASKLDLSIRFGKMEQKMATARLVATREGQNVRRSFEGFHIRMRKGKWKVDAVALKEVISIAGVFDDFRDPDETFYGIVAQRKGKNGITIEPSILANHDRTATVFGDSSQQFRISPGFRVFKKGAGNFHWNIETALQWGQFSDRNIFAGFAALDLRYRFPKILYRPALGVTISYSTGDDDTKAGGRGTFEPFFPKAVFGQAAVLNPSNLTQYHVEFSFYPRKNAKITISHDELFRSSLSDVFYDPCGDPMVPIAENLNSARHIGNQTKIEFKQKIGQHYFMVIEYSVFPPGEFLRNMERTETLHYASVKSIIRF